MADDTIKLGLDLAQTKRETADATKLMEGFKASVVTTADTFEVLDRSIDPVQQHMDKLVREAIELTQAQKAMNVVLRETETEMIAVDRAGMRVGAGFDRAGNKMAGFGQTALQSGRILQDFAQGGVGGILNNIEGLTMALGGGPGLAGIMTAVGLAAYFAGPKLKEMFGMMETPEQIDKRNKAIERQKDLVEAVAKAYKTQADELKKLRELQSPEETKREKERAEALQTKFADRGEREALVSEVAMGMITPEQRMARTETDQQLGAEAAFLRRQLAAEKDPVLRGDLQRQLRRIQQRQAAIAQSDQRERAQAEEMVAGAVIGGREEDVQGVLSRIPEGSRFRRAFASQTSAEMIRNKRLAEQAKVNQQEDEESRKEAKQEEEQATKDAQDDRKRIRDEQRRIDAADRRNAQAEAIRRRNVQRTPVAQLEQATSQLSQQMGFGVPNAAEANQMADAALRNINNGIPVQQATMMALMQKVQAINAATAQANAMWGRMQAQTQNGLGR